MRTIGSLPEIIIANEDLAVLSNLVRDALADGRFVAASRLGNELHRARIVLSRDVPEDCLTLNGSGRYLEERSGVTRDVTLVAGKGVSSFGALSVLSQVGTALLGLSVGQQIGWLDPRGNPRVIRLLEVRRRSEK